MDFLKPFRATNGKNHDLVKTQLRVILAGLVIIIIMGIFPPWNYTLELQKVHLLRPAGYAPIFSPPYAPPEFDREVRKFYGVHLDVSRLLIQWALVALAVAVILLFLRLRYQTESEAPVSPKIDKGDTRTGKLEGDCTEDESGQPDIEEIDSFIAMPESLDEFIKILRSGNVPIDALEELGGIRNCYRCGASILRPEQFAVAVLDYYGETPDSDIVELVALSEEARGDYLPEVESVDISGTCQWCGRQMSKDGDEPEVPASPKAEKDYTSSAKIEEANIPEMGSSSKLTADSDDNHPNSVDTRLSNIQPCSDSQRRILYSAFGYLWWRRERTTRNPSKMTMPVEMGATEYVITGNCELCRRNRHTRAISFSENMSFFFVRYHREFCGSVCFSCMTKRFPIFELRTALCTWWGIIGCIQGPGILIGNLFEYLNGSLHIAACKFRKA